MQSKRPMKGDDGKQITEKQQRISPTKQPYQYIFSIAVGSQKRVGLGITK